MTKVSVSGASIPIEKVKEAENGETTPLIEGRTAWPFGSFIMLNAIVGAGILTLPYSVYHTGGTTIGLIILITMGIFNYGSLLIMGWLVDTCPSKIKNMQDIVYKYVGNISGTVISILIIFRYFILCITYLVAIKNQLQSLICYNAPLETLYEDPWYLDERLWTAVVFLVFIFPLCFLPRIDQLKYVSTLASICIIYLAALVIAAYEAKELRASNSVNKTIRSNLCETEEKSGSPEKLSFLLQIFYGCPSFVLAFFFQPQAIIIYDSLRPRSLKSFLKASTSAMLFTTGLYVLVAAIAIATFGGPHLNQHILLNFDSGHPAVIVGSVFYMLKLILEYPVCHFPAREGAISVIHTILGRDLERRAEMIAIGVLTLIFTLGTFLFAMLVPNIMPVVSLCGLLAILLISLIPGGSVIMKLRRSTEVFMKWPRWKIVGMWGVSLFYIIFGFFLTAVGLYQFVSDNIVK